MANAVAERIRLNVLSTLAGITVNGGYTFDAVVEGRKRGGNRPRDGLIVVVQGDAIQDGDRDQGMRQWKQPYSLVCFYVDSDTSTADPDAVLNNRRADIEKILMIDTNRTDSNGAQLAAYTEIKEPETQDDEAGQFSVVIVNADVLFRTSWNDPYTLR